MSKITRQSTKTNTFTLWPSFARTVTSRRSLSRLAASEKQKVRGDFSFVPVEGISLSFIAVEKLLYLDSCRKQLWILLLHCSPGAELPELRGAT
jgi:hypothetical protein